jgi:hypothetical protein
MVPCDARLVPGAKVRRYEELRHPAAEDVGPPVPERSLRRRVELGDPSPRVDGHDGVQRGIDHGRLPHLRLANELARARVLEELPDLVADHRESTKQLGVAKLHFRAVQLDHPANRAALHRDDDSAAEPDVGGVMRVRRRRLASQVRDPHRLAGTPHPSRELLPEAE